MIEHTSPTGSDHSAVENPASNDAAFWHGLIDEQGAGDFLGLTARCLQGWRYKGDGPKYLRLSARCIRYRRADLRAWFEDRLRTSTSDTGQAAA